MIMIIRKTFGKIIRIGMKMRTKGGGGGGGGWFKKIYPAWQTALIR